MDEEPGSPAAKSKLVSRTVTEPADAADARARAARQPNATRIRSMKVFALKCRGGGIAPFTSNIPRAAETAGGMRRAVRPDNPESDKRRRGRQRHEKSTAGV